MNLEKHIEAIIFSSEQAVTVSELVKSLERSLETTLDKKEIESAIDQLVLKFKNDDFAFELKDISGGYQFLTKATYHKTISDFLNIRSKSRLSTAAMETLSIIAYKQPIPKSEIEHIRGVNCDYTIQKLLEKDLIAIIGRAESPGRPLIYATSKSFMDYFGINSLEDLPKLKEIETPDNQIGLVRIEEISPDNN